MRWLRAVGVLVATIVVVVVVGLWATAPPTLSDAEQVWCGEHSFPGGFSDPAGGALVEQAILKLGLIPSARTVADVDLAWASSPGRGYSWQATWPYIKGCIAAFDASH